MDLITDHPVLSPFPPDPRRALHNLELHVSHACNLTCEGCAHFSDGGHKGLISLEEAAASIAAWQFFGGRTAILALGNGITASFMNNAQTSSAIQAGGTYPPTWGDKTTDRLGYDGSGRLIAKRYLPAGSTTSLVANSTLYDHSSNKLFERALHAENRSNLYPSYDSMNRLLEYQRGTLASGGGSITAPISLPGTNQEQDYDLDALGNWSNTTITPESGSPAVQTRTHNKLNAVTKYGTTDVHYDHGNNVAPHANRGNGNINDDGIRTYAYDALNRLTTVKRKSDGATIGQYTYDAIGRRIRKVVTNGGLSGTIANNTYRYVLDGQQIVEELDGSNSTTREFIWGQYIDELIQMKTYVNTGSQPLTAGTYYMLSDLLYRSQALTDSSGNIVEAYDTDAYGNTLIYSRAGVDNIWFTDDDVASPQPACETIFTGRQYDPETGNYYYRARYYNTKLGRFVGRDPMAYLDSVNLYSFVRSAPTVLVDPSGFGVTISGNGITIDLGHAFEIFGIQLAGFRLKGSGNVSVGVAALPAAKCKTASLLSPPVITPPRVTVNLSNRTASVSVGVTEGPLTSTSNLIIGFPHWNEMTVTGGASVFFSYLHWSSTCGCIRLSATFVLSVEQDIHGALAVAALAVFLVAPEADAAAAGVSFGLQVIDAAIATATAILAAKPQFAG